MHASKPCWKVAGMLRSSRGKGYLLLGKPSVRVCPRVQDAGVMSEAPKNLKLGKAHMEHFFAGAESAIRGGVEAVVEELDQANNQRPTKILLVGGLGSSSYICTELKRLMKHHNWGIDVVRPKEDLAATAVVQGEPGSAMDRVMPLKQALVKQMGSCQLAAASKFVKTVLYASCLLNRE